MTSQLMTSQHNTAGDAESAVRAAVTNCDDRTAVLTQIPEVVVVWYATLSTCFIMKIVVHQQRSGIAMRMRLEQRN